MEFIIDIIQLIGLLVVIPIFILMCIDTLTTLMVTISHSDYRTILDDVEFKVDEVKYLIPTEGSKTGIHFICEIPNMFDEDEGIVYKLLYRITDRLMLYKYQIILKNNLRIRVPIWSKNHKIIKGLLENH